jgi:hypothetical protein
MSLSQARGALKDVAQGSSESFRNLSDAMKDELIQELDEYKATQAKGVRKSNKSRINDITYTVDLVEKEVCHCCASFGFFFNLMPHDSSSTSKLAPVPSSSSMVVVGLQTLPFAQCPLLLNALKIFYLKS